MNALLQVVAGVAVAVPFAWSWPECEAREVAGCGTTAHSVEIAGVQLVTQEYGEGWDGIRPFNAQSRGMTVALFVRSESKDIVAVDGDGSKVARFADDKQTSLLGDTFQDGLGSFPKVSEDRAVAMVEVVGTVLPHEEATKVKLEAAIALRTASKSETLSSKAGALTKGTTLTAGTWSFEVTEVDGQQFTIQTQTNPGAISAYRFRDGDGNEIPADERGSSSMTSGDSGTWTFSFALEKATKTVALEVDAWTDMATVRVPVMLEIPLPR